MLVFLGSRTCCRPVKKPAVNLSDTSVFFSTRACYVTVKPDLSFCNIEDEEDVIIACTALIVPLM